MTKPIIIDAHNPHSASPLMALWPEPVGSAGWRIWQMLGVSKEEYIRGWDRWNMVNSVVWDGGAAWRAGLDIWAKTEGRKVIVLGRKAAFHLRLPEFAEWFFPNLDDTGREWRIVPALTKRLYEDPTLGLRVALLLKDWHENRREE